MTHAVPVKPHPHNIAALGNSPEFGEIRLNHKTWQPQAWAPAQLLFSRALSFCIHAALPQIPLFPGSRLSERKGNRSLGNSSKRPNYCPLMAGNKFPCSSSSAEYSTSSTMCPQRPEEKIKCPGARVKGSCNLGAGNWNLVLWKSNKYS